MKLTLKILFFCILIQADSFNREFEKEITTGIFRKINYKLVPKSIKEKYNCNLKSTIGNKMHQSGCTSGKKMIVNWLVKNENNIYVASINSCGAWTSNTNYIVIDGIANKLNINTRFNSFQELKKDYIKK